MVVPVTVPAGTETNILAGLEFTPELPCEAPDGPCENKATWRSINPCCGTGGLICEHHAHLGRIACAVFATKVMSCADCKTNFPLGDIQFEPLP